MATADHRRRWAEEDRSAAQLLCRYAREAQCPWEVEEHAPPPCQAVCVSVSAPFRQSLAEDEARFQCSAWSVDKSAFTFAPPPSPAPWLDPFAQLQHCPRGPHLAPGDAHGAEEEQGARGRWPVSNTAACVRKPSVVPAPVRNRASHAPPRARGGTSSAGATQPAPSFADTGRRRVITDSDSAHADALLRRIEAAFVQMRGDVVSAVASAQPHHHLPPLGAREKGSEQDGMTVAHDTVELQALHAAVEGHVGNLRAEVETLALELPMKVAQECKAQVLHALQQQPIQLRGPLRSVTVHPGVVASLQKP